MSTPIVKKLSVLFLMGLSLVGCSIKEDRSVCPVFLNVSFTNREDITRDVSLLGWNDIELFREAVEVEKYDPYWVKALHKQEITLSAYMGVSESTDNGHHILISPGHQSDSLYAFYTDVDCRGDEAFAEVTLHKQFCTVHLDINQPVDRMKDFRFLVEGNTCGFDLFTFQPVPGSFRCEPAAREGERIVDFRIPRQSDDSMIVSIWFKHPESGTFEPLGAFPLGEYISRLGYSWKAEELQDIYVRIDFLLGVFSIEVEGWEEGLTVSFIEQ